MKTADFINEKMSELNLKPKDIVMATGVSRGTVSFWRSGHSVPHGVNLLKLAEVLRVSPEEILSSEEQFIQKNQLANTTSKKISLRLKQLKLKQSDIVLQVGASKGAVSMWLNGKSKPKGQYLFKLADLLKVSPEWIISNTSEEPINPLKSNNYNHEHVVSLSSLSTRKSPELIQYESKLTHFFSSYVIPLFPEKTDIICTQVDSECSALNKGSFVGIDRTVNQYQNKGLYVTEKDDVIDIEMIEGSNDHPRAILGKVIWFSSLCP